jgi:hypothetical protein
MKNLQRFHDFSESLNESKKRPINTSGIRKNLMHELLNIPENKKIADVYKSGKKLAEDLVAAIKREKIAPEKDVQKKAASMLVFAGNWPKTNKKNSVFDVAARHIKTLF